MGSYQGVCHILNSYLGRIALAINVNMPQISKRWTIILSKVLPFKMANMKPPVSVLKEKVYLLESFPRNTSQQLEIDSEVFVVLREFVWWETHLYCGAAVWWFVTAVNVSTEALWQTFMYKNWVVLLSGTGYLAVPVLPLLWYPGKPAFCWHPLSKPS